MKHRPPVNVVTGAIGPWIDFLEPSGSQPERKPRYCGSNGLHRKSCFLVSTDAKVCKPAPSAGTVTLDQRWQHAVRHNLKVVGSSPTPVTKTPLKT